MTHPGTVRLWANCACAGTDSSVTGVAQRVKGTPNHKLNPRKPLIDLKDSPQHIYRIEAEAAVLQTQNHPMKIDLHMSIQACNENSIQWHSIVAELFN